MGFLRKLFGGGAATKEPNVVEEEAYNGFHIAAAPMAEGGQYRLAATITKGEGEDMRSHHLIRADMFSSESEAAQFAIRKAKQMIDEQGERIFA